MSTHLVTLLWNLVQNDLYIVIMVMFVRGAYPNLSIGSLCHDKIHDGT